VIGQKQAQMFLILTFALSKMFPTAAVDMLVINGLAYYTMELITAVSF
jgi:hypothetical protein